MYLFKNACKNMLRNVGRNAFIMMLMSAILSCVLIAFQINATSITLMDQVREQQQAQVYILHNIEKYKAENDAYMKEHNYELNEDGFIDTFILPENSYDDLEEFATSKYVQSKDISYCFQYETSTLSALNEDGNDYFNTHNPYPEMGERAKEYALGNVWAYQKFDNVSNTYFHTGERKIQEGKIPEKTKECIVSYEFAQLNNLSVGDTITIQKSSWDRVLEQPKLELNITGIYFDGTQADKRQDDVFGNGVVPEVDDEPMLPVENRRNDIITTEETIFEYAQLLEKRADMTEDRLMNRGIFYYYSFILDDAEHIDEFQQELYEKGLHPAYEVYLQNEYKYNQVVTPVMELGKVSDLLTLSIIGFGSSLLILISFLLIRLRTYEIGVLSAMGLRKLHITKMFIWESLILTFVSLCVAFVIGMSLGKPITNNLIEAQMETSMKNMNQDDLKEVSIHLQADDIIEVIALALLLGTLTSMSGVWYTMRFEPIKILANRE